MSGTGQSAAETTRSKRYEALLRVSQTLISIRSSEELFSILARELRAVVNFYVMGVGIYDEKTHEMNTMSYGEPGVPLQAPKFAPEETFSWWVYQRMIWSSVSRSGKARTWNQRYAPSARRQRCSMS